jgi:predicted dehydrogenase
MWLHLPETEIVAVADADAKGLAAEMKKLKLDKGFVDYRAMLAEIKPDIVSIATRHIDQHRDMALAAIASGARGVYMEKPFCRSLVEADEIVAACERRNVKLALAHRNRYHPALPVAAKDAAIGELRELRGRGKEDDRGGVLDLWVLGSHVFNLAHFIAGKPLACTARLLQDGRPVTRADLQEGAEGVGPVAGNELHARFEMERGVPLVFKSVRRAGSKAAGFGLQLVGTKGIIDLHADDDPFARLADKPVGSSGPDVLKQVNGHEPAGRDLLAAMREDRAPLCDARAGRVTIEMISAVLESHRLGGQRVTFPLKTRQNPLTLLS